MIRRHLEKLGHGFNLSEIKEALDILSGTMMEIFLLDDEAAQQRGDAQALNQGNDPDQATPKISPKRTRRGKHRLLR